MESSRSTRPREAGQAIIIIVFAFVGLLAFVGISVDLGRYLVAQAQLRRAVDASALAGAAQFRLAGLTASDAAVYDKVNQAARAMLRAHNVSTSTLETGVGVFTTYNDPSMVTSPPTKKVRVEAKAELPMIFLSLVGWRTVALSADSTSEAASVDVALVLDISDSMADDTPCAGSDFACQYTCVQARSCQPFETVRSSALEFLNYLSPGYDRVTVIPFAGKVGYCTQFGETWPDCGISGYNSPNPSGSPNPTYLQMPWTPDKILTNIDDARTFIDNLKMAIPGWALNPATGQPIIPTPPCPGYNATDGWDPRQCVNTNTGGGLRAGATELLKEFDSRYADPGAGRVWGPNHSSKERLRVIVILSDGAVTMGGLPVPGEGGDYGLPSGSRDPYGFCPRSTWGLQTATSGPFCRAAWPGFMIGSGRHISTSTEYDALDYTLDWADFAMLEPPPNGNGNGIIVFSIGLGNKVIAETRGDPQVGEKLLRYIAAGGDDGKLQTDLCAGVLSGQSCGNYYFAPTSAQLLDVFKAIAGRIFTRINQ